jgi:uracil DNA glycosylase
MAEKTEKQKQGILVLDEVFLRESISVNSQTYIGLEDFGDKLENKSSQKANHALVFMWQSLADNVVQPIAVFASKESVKG